MFAIEKRIYRIHKRLQPQDTCFQKLPGSRLIKKQYKILTLIKLLTLMIDIPFLRYMRSVQGLRNWHTKVKL